MKGQHMKGSNRMSNLVLTGAILCLTCTAHADDTLYQTGFESPTFVAGQPINGQSDWQEYQSNGAGIITTSHPASGQQSLQINGSALSFVPQFGLYDAYDSPNPTWNFSQYPTVQLNAEVMLNGSSTGSTIADDLISANFDIETQNTEVGTMWISSDGHVQYLSGADFGPTDDGYLGPAVTLGQYHDLSMLLNTDTLTDSFFVDGQFIGSLPMPVGALSDNSFYFGLLMAAVPDQPGFDHTQYTGNFDNVSLTGTAVPEPSSPALLTGLGFCCLSLLFRRRHSRQTVR